MKTRLNLTIEEKLLDSIKQYAHTKHKSVSELVEEYFKSIARGRRRNILDEVEKLKRPNLNSGEDLKELYYLNQSKKYGF